MQPKPWYLKKALWLGAAASIFAIVSAAIPAFGSFWTGNGDTILMLIFGVVNMILSALRKETME